ncbi:MAG: hypothetical protein ACTTJ1_07505, partial [Treponema sp.]
FYSCGGFNTPTLCVVTKGIKAECNHLMRTTYPDACVGVVDSCFYIRKKLVSAAVLFLFMLTGTWAIAVGAEICSNPKTDFSGKNTAAFEAAFIFHTDRIPVCAEIKTGYNPFIKSFDLILAADFLPFNPSLNKNGNIKFYGGFGSCAGIKISEKILYSAGLRMTGGLSFIFYDGFLELFLQQTIQPEIDFCTDNRCNYLLALPSAAGFRIWY